MKKKKLFIVFSFLLFLLISTKVQASSSAISISPSNPKVGDDVTVTVTVNNVNTATIYAEVSGVISDTIKLVDGSLSGAPRNFSTSKTYKCNSEGAMTVRTTSSSRAILSGKDVDVTASASVTIKNNENSSTNPSTPPTNISTEKSSNANLKNLGIRPNDFKGFKAGTTKYNVTVPFEVESVEVYAEKQDSKAKVTGTGNKKLKEGSNVVDVVVTAEDGTKKKYTINIVRNSEVTNNEVVPNVPDDVGEKIQELRLTAIAIQDDLTLKLSPDFNSEVFEYTLELKEDLEKLELTGIPNLNSAIVEIKGNNILTEKENEIILIVSATGYENAVYRINVIKNLPEEKEEEKEELPEPTNKDELDNSYEMTRKIIICAVATLIIITIIVIALLKKRKRHKKFNDTDYEEEHYNTDNNMKNSNYENNETEGDISSVEDYEVPQGYTTEIETEEYESDRRKRRGKGKHF